MTLRSLDQILKMLKDSEWHEIEEIKTKTRLSNMKMQLVTEFLARYGFIRLDRKNGRMKISKHLERFYCRISASEAENSR